MHFWHAVYSRKIILVETSILFCRRYTRIYADKEISAFICVHPRPIFPRSRIVIKTQHFCNRSLASLTIMSIDKNKIKTQDELDEPAPMDQAEQRVEAEMKKLEGQAKKEVAEGLRQQDENNTE
jgi:hypothetical protein